MIRECLLLIAICMASPSSWGDDGLVIGKFGLGLNQANPLTNKLVAIGYQNTLTRLLDYQLEGGYFSELTTARHFWFVGPSIGLALKNDGHFIKTFVGPAFVNPTDAHLSTPIQFNTDIEIGLRDSRGVGMGMGYKHMSNAGIAGENLGRDFLYFKIQF